jgi:hypothetical protein
MTTIKQLQNMPIGQRWGGETFTIKTAKKTWQTKDIWWHQVILVDSEGGEMPADIKIGTYTPLHSGWEIKVIVAQVLEAEYLGKDRKKLVVDQYLIPSTPIEEYESRQAELDKEAKLVIESKIRCWIVAASITGIQQTKKQLLEWQDFILKGE